MALTDKPLPDRSVLDDGPPPELRFRHRVRPLASLREFWAARNLTWTLAERDIRARYKQAFLGFSWAVVIPLVMMLAFNVFFKRVAKIDTHGVPYPLFSYLGLLPWQFFSGSVGSGGYAFITDSQLLNKIYCPREVFPLADIIGVGVDSLISTGVLGVLFVVFGFLPHGASIWVPVLLLIQIAFTVGVTLGICGLFVYIRDLKQVVPIILQLGLFATPVAWGLESIPAAWRGLYCTINPLGVVIDGYRQTVLYGRPPQWELVMYAAISSTIYLVAGYLVLKRLEVGFADVA
jgi:ABC-2 type transport system permease protein/lipopolysaccharide transport system permease protein